jgi:hypothetical protein
MPQVRGAIRVNGRPVACKLELYAVPAMAAQAVRAASTSARTRTPARVAVQAERQIGGAVFAHDGGRDGAFSFPGDGIGASDELFFRLLADEDRGRVRVASDAGDGELMTVEYRHPVSGTIPPSAWAQPVTIDIATGNEPGRALAVFEVLHRAAAWYRARVSALPKVLARYPQPGGSQYRVMDRSPQGEHLLDVGSADWVNDWVLVHEYGHHAFWRARTDTDAWIALFQRNPYAAGFAAAHNRSRGRLPDTGDQPASSSAADAMVEARLWVDFIEGYADFFAGCMLGSPELALRSTRYSCNLETQLLRAAGSERRLAEDTSLFGETRVAAYLWDLFDTEVDQRPMPGGTTVADHFSMPFSRFQDIIASWRPRNVLQFHRALREHYGARMGEPTQRRIDDVAVLNGLGGFRELTNSLSGNIRTRFQRLSQLP